jgi:metal-responsive CopG/Arc/MetJ family transcriptional regulator
MRAVQMTLDEELLREVDRAVRRLRTTRSEFTRSALKAAVARVEEKELEERHRHGYSLRPARKGEFDA